MYYIIKAQRGKHKTSKKSKIRVATYRQERKIVMKKNVVVYVDEKTALVTKTFKKNACIFGTDEFKLWREYKAMFPNAVMTTKDIKKNPNKKTRRNLTFANMVEYMKTQENSEDLLAEFETMKSRSKIQASPYQYVLSWFEAKFEGYNDLKQFMAQKEEERSAEDAASETAND